MKRSRMLARLLAAISMTVALSAWSAELQAPSLDGITLEKAGGESVPLQKLVAAHRFTVVMFFSETCPCFAIHTERLRDLARELSPKGVDFVVVDSERHAASDPRPAAVAGTDLAILRDPGGRLARRLGAQYATESFVFDASSRLRYRGGIDDQRKHLGPNAKAHLHDALIHLLDNDAPAFVTAKALGCALRLL
jgi:hypothetical protein